MVELCHTHPILCGHLFLVSCEESISSVDSYVLTRPSLYETEKEHVLVAMNLSIGGREGMVLFDPGYHVGRVLTVMKDGLYPHTGRFMQSEDAYRCKEYSYAYSLKNEDYIVWRVVENDMSGIRMEKLIENVIFIGAPYLSPVDVTERRNLVFDFKCLVKRTTKGALVCGVYFHISGKEPAMANFTVFRREDDGVVIREKIRFEALRTGLSLMQGINISTCEKQLGLKNGELFGILNMMEVILKDGDFVRQMLSINAQVHGISPQ